MAENQNGSEDRTCWFVGSMYYQTQDQMPRFIEEGIWENGYKDKYLDLVRSIQPGDRIAIKSTYTRKKDLPFDNRGHTVSCMAIKAIGTVTKNRGDGRIVEVDWQPLDTPKEWYFYTYRGTIWRVAPGTHDGASDALIAFTFEDQPQDYDYWRNDPYWRDRFGDKPETERRFQWTRFYEAIADGLLRYKDHRSVLVEAIHGIASRVDGLSHLTDQFEGGTTGPLRDICPFTAFGIFNRGISDENRKLIAKKLAEFLEVDEPVPVTFEGIPVLNNMKSWYFHYDQHRKPGDIDSLWDVFAAAINYASSDEPESRSEFISAFDIAMSKPQVAWNLTFGLYWARPWQFLSLDTKSRVYIKNRLGLEIGHGGPKKRCSGAEYLSMIEMFEERFREDSYSVHSFPELSLRAWQYKGDDEEEVEDPDGTNGTGDGEDDPAVEPVNPYSIQDILDAGCFLSKNELNIILERIRTKKNVILQGPPGTGKTWLAKKLAYALMGEFDESRVRSVQFHPNLSYEDFVRGWRPSADGKLDLIDGPFLQMINRAKKEPNVKSVLVIEEINRGNPAQIFGEMLTLLEADKRTPDEAIELCYRKDKTERVHIPENLYVIGTMNIADRSLALVDLALRRRFAFVDMEPRLGQPWRDWVSQRFKFDVAFIDAIEQRIIKLNEDIEADSSLGRQFRIGHSYVTPPDNGKITDPKKWYLQVVYTEIGPLLEEYWFDAVQKAHSARDRLVEGL